MKEKLNLSPEIIQDSVKVEEVLLKGTEIIENGQIKEVAQTILKSGGKRLRPILVLVSGLTGKYQLRKLIPAAVAIELLHIASLVHDDILDGAKTRRGAPTANSIIGREAAISAGDFLFAKTFEILSDLKNNDVAKIMAEASNALSLGELFQMEIAHWTGQSEIGYLRIIRSKTAALFSAACKIGAVLAEAGKDDIKMLSSYGDSVGLAFQIYDDILDIVGDEKVMGKPAGNDLREGKVTLPVIYALEETNYSKSITSVIEKERTDDGSIKIALRTIIEETSAVDKAKEEAKKYIKAALRAAESLSSKEAKENLVNIANFITTRLY